MDRILDFIEAMNLQTIFSVGVIFWYFTRELRKEIKEEILSIRQEISEIRKENFSQTQRSDRLYEMFVQLLKEGKNG